VIADQGTKLGNARLDSLACNANRDRLLWTLVPMIRNHHARLEVYVGPDERVADKAQVRNPRGVENDRGFDLAGWADGHPTIEKHAAAKVCRRSHEAPGRDYGRRLDNRARLDRGFVVDQETCRLAKRRSIKRGSESLNAA
jgi:hypothetical protein